jgi:hypothetical protein
MTAARCQLEVVICLPNGPHATLQKAPTMELDAMRPSSAEEVWGPRSPLLWGTTAESGREDLAGWLDHVTSRTLQAKPRLAAARFLPRWAARLLDPASAQTLADVQRAAELAPDEPLFAQRVTYLQRLRQLS